MVCTAALSFSAVLIGRKRSWVIIQSVLPQDSKFYISGDIISFVIMFLQTRSQYFYTCCGGFRFDTILKGIGLKCVLRTCVSLDILRQTFLQQFPIFLLLFFLAINIFHFTNRCN